MTLNNTAPYSTRKRGERTIAYINYILPQLIISGSPVSLKPGISDGEQSRPPGRVTI